MHQVKQFLSLHWDRRSPLLLACSGGPDSKALLYLLKDEVPLQVAHVDHGWRPESAAEAQQLKKEVEGLGIPFHLMTLQETEQKENEARSARYKEFIQVACSTGAQAILLAHQMEDQAETVLKRIFEGASLPNCRGMEPVTLREKIPLWRPLLDVSKKELLAFLKEKNIYYFTDSTNLDSRYLRGRMRTKIFPMLEEAFGKAIVPNLCLLGHRAGELKTHLDKQLEGIDDTLLEHLLRSTQQLNREELSQQIKKLKKSSCLQ